MSEQNDANNKTEFGFEDEIIQRIDNLTTDERTRFGPAITQAELILSEQEDWNLNHFSQMISRRKNLLRMYRLLGITFTASYVLIFLKFTMGHGLRPAMALAALGALVITGYQTKNIMQAQRRLRDLHRLDYPRALGPLAELLEFGDTDARAIARSNLVYLLPRIGATDAEQMNENQRDCLYRALRSNDKELTLNILQLLKRTGDIRALRYVERLVWKKVHSAKDPRVLAEAQSCRAYLLECVKKDQMVQTLLRPTASPDETADTLLRPARGTEEPDTSLLLRPSTPPEQEQTQSVTQAEAEKEPPP